MNTLITQDYTDFNNQILRAQIGGGSKLGANQHLIKKLSIEHTVKINVVVYGNGLWSVLGLDKEGNQTLSFTCVAKSDDLTSFFGDWHSKLAKAQDYKTAQMLDVKDLID